MTKEMRIVDRAAVWSLDLVLALWRAAIDDPDDRLPREAASMHVAEANTRLRPLGLYWAPYTSELIADDDVELTDELRAQALLVLDDSYQVTLATFARTGEEG